jgi:hypothetical protein
MNLRTLIAPVRKILTVAAVTAVAATCLGSAGTSSSATAGHHRSDSTSATKEWKAVTTTTPVAGTSKTKEW